MQKKSDCLKICLLIAAVLLFGDRWMLAQSGAPSDSKSTPSSGTTTDSTTSSPTDSSTSPTGTTAGGAAAFASADAGSVDQSSGSGTIDPNSGTGYNSLNFQADLFTGRFSYTVPIKVAPARQGASPKLALGYNSAAGNGWCGVGWTLDTAYIQRDVRFGVPIPWAQTNNGSVSYNLPLTRYDDSKGFVASIGGSGGVLVSINQTNQNPIVFRQQVDTGFLTYYYYTNNNNWRVVDKSGNTFYFGEGATNQMVNTKPGWATNSGSSTFRWALDRVIDANGNETFLNYTTDHGALYLTNILYNANTNSSALAANDEVDFILTNRPDTSITFISGYRVQIGQLLSEIRVKAGGANVCKYSLNYTKSPSSLRSLLTSVTEYGSDFTTALPSVTFNYQTKPFTFGSETDWTGLDTQSQTSSDWGSVKGNSGGINTFLELVDMDADGLPDRLMRKKNNPFGYFYVQRNTGTNFAPNGTSYQWGNVENQGNAGDNGWNSPNAGDSTAGTAYIDTKDINGDGYPDRVMRLDSAPFTNFLVQLNSGVSHISNSFAASILWGR